MIFSKTPYRISFFGGGTDYPEYYLEHGGKTLGGSIDKYCYLNVRKLPPYFDYKHRIVYSKQENTQGIEDIIHPSVRETFRFLNVHEGISIHHDGDIPAKSGMGSSSAFTVGLLHSLNALRGKMSSKEDLANNAIFIEQKMILENVGSQDQVFAAYGGLNLIHFRENGKIIVEPLIMPAERLLNLEQNILLFFSGISRMASDIAGQQIKNTHLNITNLNTMKSLVDEAYNILTSNTNLNEFGKLLNYTWDLKKSLSSKITNSELDSIYAAALKAGAIGGKLLGAGGGGFMAFYVEKENHPQVINALKNYLHIPFKFDFGGSQIVIYKPEMDNTL